ncbi:transporter substrate-binding domain-containing protein [Alkalihalobacillus sp. AL-G]|uniref:transporter substrate-binding domain-containing protein n=1 Tax=Alkalihalobacillus sp. AL-G TaxID=2926399 RepID=UPI00272AB5E9|nr:transporter substrate-binding domain-containing protein [Alkalihalobacillus sp. AL-G]WLD91966.1 transporter substrate-binding domain-containing protein [Alkalihalobacillus sp. AL-G]
MKKLMILIGMLLIVMSLAACGGSGSGAASADKKTLVMGTSADYPPYEYIDTAKGSEVIGFDIDIAKQITTNLGYELEIKNMDFNSLIEALKNDRVDFVMAGMTPTEKRKNSVDFSNIYYKAKQLIMTTDDNNIGSIDDLNGKKVAVQLGSIQEKEAEKIQQQVDIEIVKLNKIPEIVQELKSGRIDAMIIEDAVAFGFLEKDQSLDTFEIKKPAEKTAGSAVAFQKNSHIKEAFNKELTKMKENGDLDKIAEKWFTTK